MLIDLSIFEIKKKVCSCAVIKPFLILIQYIDLTFLLLLLRLKVFLRVHMQ